MPRQSSENQDDAGPQKGDARGASPQDVNPKLVAIFQQMADVTELLGGDRFRVNAFAKAARVIGELAEDLGRIWHAGGEVEKALTDLDGIGKGTAARIAEFIRTGRIEDHRKLMTQVPAGLPDLLDVPGLGPKTVALLWKEAGIEGLDDLKEKLKDDSLADLPGWVRRNSTTCARVLHSPSQPGDASAWVRPCPWPDGSPTACARSRA